MSIKCGACGGEWDFLHYYYCGTGFACSECGSKEGHEQVCSQFERDRVVYQSPPLVSDAEKRKAAPVCSGVLDYFPDSILAIARLSKIGNDQHNPGEPLHWAKEKSTDESDALVRHQIERHGIDSDGVPHAVKVAWRGLAQLQRMIEADPKLKAWARGE